MTEIDRPKAADATALTTLAAMRELKVELTRFMMSYKFASDEKTCGRRPMPPTAST